jgi:hypothetical protein
MMTELPCEHYSHRFAFRLNRNPACATDKFSRLILLIGFCAGLLLTLLGLFHFCPDVLVGAVDMEKNMPKAQTSVQTSLSPDIFNALIALTGLLLIGMVFLKFSCSKKILFDGENFRVTHRRFFRNCHSFEEPLYCYTGVRLRVRFYQFGLWAKNKFIVELYHQDPSKIIPLYITTRRKGIRRIWQNYARILHMPGITISEKGMVSHNLKNLHQPYAEVLVKWHLPPDFARRMEKPSYVAFKSKATGEKMIRIGKTFWDVFGVLSLLSVAILGSFLIFAASNHQLLLQHLSPYAVWGGYVGIGLLIFYLVAGLSTRDVIFVAREKVYIFRRILGLKIRVGIIPMQSIQGIDINYTPTSDRYYLFIAASGNNYILGNKMPVEALRWLRAVLINEIIGN